MTQHSGDDQQVGGTGDNMSAEKATYEGADPSHRVFMGEEPATTNGNIYKDNQYTRE